ncbi:uncharacterized protein A1O5_06983 [Cladophialophora psammophila CBS 110553]|uniref:Uncharacterized protein n=1 Tax=Cladophialophora psammophila CBS 110553 TaxID=1182543 RepID=W9WXZ4_9EURO|nr:uncharacterized protein A1O5_06983 [Cladophialophora psammophila CBS 110553]EXJ69910.1 hypothetical protein A1O5_06983 [Cladophialophora psammophila CBS 110553]
MGRRRAWSSEETNELYNALDECVKEGLASFHHAVAKIEQHLLTTLKKEDTPLSEKEVKTKLYGSGKKVGVSAEKLVTEWRRHRQQFVAEGHQRQSAT